MPQRILLIDDDPALRTALSDMLSFHFPTVETTAVDSGPAAIVEVSRHEFDLVLCDLIMPGMDGVATIKELRKTSPHLRIYLMTGHPEPNTVFEDAAANGFFKKPLERPQFLAAMKRTLYSVTLDKEARSITHNARESLRLAQRQHSEIASRLKDRRNGQ